MMLPLSKTLDPLDYTLLGPELTRVDAVGIAGQHDQRRWEYAMALHAISRWRNSPPEVARVYQPRLYDVGGAGSSFHTMPNAISYVVDPAVAPATSPYAFATDLHTFCKAKPPCADIVTCLSVLEHVPDDGAFLQDLVRLLRPGGLLFLTVDCWDGEGPDTAHFSHMRQRIYSMLGWRALGHALQSCRAVPFGEADWTYHGHQLYGSYSFASLCVLKESR